MKTSYQLTPAHSTAAGFTIIELLITLTVFGVIIVGALGFMSAQNRAFHAGLDRMIGLQTARFAVQVLEGDIATAGTNIPAGQPPVVLADDDVFAFTADYVTRRANDPFAVFYDPDAPVGQVSVPTIKTTLPNSAFAWPDTAYLASGVLSPAELITFFFRPDSSTARTDDYVLFRKVNTAAPELVTNNLLQPTSGPFFRYLTDNGTTIDSVAAAALPLTHGIPIHHATLDTGVVSMVDSVRGVRVSLKATNGQTGANEKTAELSRIIRLPNVNLVMVEACGAAPILGQALAAVLSATPTGDPAIKLDWNEATDESGGEGDVMRYVIWRRSPPDNTWTEPYLSMAAGQPSYTYLDAAVTPGTTYEYGLAAQDCTPALSPITASVQVAIP